MGGRWPSRRCQLAVGFVPGYRRVLGWHASSKNTRVTRVILHQLVYFEFWLALLSENGRYMKVHSKSQRLLYCPAYNIGFHPSCPSISFADLYCNPASYFTNMLFQATHSWDWQITSMKRLRIPSVGDFVYRSWSLETLKHLKAKHLKAKPSSTIEEVLQPVQIHRREPRIRCYLQLRPSFVQASHQTLAIQPRLILSNPVKLLVNVKASLNG